MKKIYRIPLLVSLIFLSALSNIQSQKLGYVYFADSVYMQGKLYHGHPKQKKETDNNFYFQKTGSKELIQLMPNNVATFGIDKKVKYTSITHPLLNSNNPVFLKELSSGDFLIYKDLVGRKDYYFQEKGKEFKKIPVDGSANKSFWDGVMSAREVTFFKPEYFQKKEKRMERLGYFLNDKDLITIPRTMIAFEVLYQWKSLSSNNLTMSQTLYLEDKNKFDLHSIGFGIAHNLPVRVAGGYAYFSQRLGIDKWSANYFNENAERIFDFNLSVIYLDYQTGIKVIMSRNKLLPFFEIGAGLNYKLNDKTNVFRIDKEPGVNRTYLLRDNIFSDFILYPILRGGISKPFAGRIFSTGIQYKKDVFINPEVRSDVNSFGLFILMNL